MLMLSIKTHIKVWDFYIGREIRKRLGYRRILFVANNMMNLVVLYPLYRILASNLGNRIFFTSCSDRRNIFDCTDDLFDISFLNNSYIPARKASLMSWDVVIAPDVLIPWIKRGTRLVQIFHGIAAKMVQFEGKKVDYRFHPYLRKFDLLLFPNKYYLDMASRLGVLKPGAISEVVGYLGLDDIWSGDIKIPAYLYEATRGKLVVMWAVTYNSKRRFSYEKYDSLLRRLSGCDDTFIFIKPHPVLFREIDRNEFCKWIESYFRNGNYKICISDPYVALFLSDIYIGDFSSLTLEAIALGKKVIFWDSENALEWVGDVEQLELIREYSLGLGSLDELSCDLLKNCYTRKNTFDSSLSSIIREKYLANIGKAADIAYSILRLYDLVL